VGVNRRENGANRLTRCRTTLLTQHRDEVYVNVRKMTVMDSLNSKPVHQATHGRLLCTDNGDVVFGATSSYAGFAACTLVDVDRHPPLNITVEFLHDFSLLLRQNVSGQIVNPLVESSQQA
jgi:hypothetical protein